MRRQSAVVTVAVAVGALWLALPATASATSAAHVAPGVLAAVSGGTWGTAEQIPGLAALSHGQATEVRSVSCGSAGNCSGGGGYATDPSHGQAFVVSQVNGTWGTALEVPGIAALNQGGGAEINSVACASAGNCSAGGHYVDAFGRFQGFVVSQVTGTWGTAQAVPRLAALNVGGGAQVWSVSCGSAGNCSAVGNYIDASGHQQVFVVTQINSIWGKAQEVPGTAALNVGGFASLLSVSCGAAGSCSAGGEYVDAIHLVQAFVVSEKNGIWGSAEEVPGTAALNPRGSADVMSVSCPGAGDCTAGGDAGGRPFVVSEKNGIWGTAKVVPGRSVLNWTSADVTAVSCVSAGNCGAGGIYGTVAGGQVFVVSETNGTWGTAQEVPGTAALNQGVNDVLFSLSCGAPGDCSTGGFYQDGVMHLQAYVASQANGAWGTAQEVPGTAALNAGGLAELFTVSCASAGSCSAGGSYTDSSGQRQAFVVSETTGA